MMKLILLCGAFLLATAISHAAGVQPSTAPAVTAIDTATVQAVTTQWITVDQLNGQKASLQARIDSATTEFQRIEDQYNTNIAYWQELLKQINAMIFTATGK